MTRDYSDIINLERPISNRPKMPLEKRAKIFMPFAALKGYENAIANKQKHRCYKRELSDEEIEALNRNLLMMDKGDSTTIEFFFNDPGPDGNGGFAEGYYKEISGTVVSIDNIYRKIRILTNEETGFIDIRYNDIVSFK